MISNNCISFKKFAESLYKNKEFNCNYSDEGIFISDMTKRYKEVAEALELDPQYLKKGNNYIIFKEDEGFIIKVILDDYSNNDNMINIRKEQFEKVDSEYLESIINGFKKILLRNDINDADLREQLKKVEKQTKINVRKKCFEVENVIQSILKEVQEYRSDNIYLIGDTDNIIDDLEKLKINLEQTYDNLLISENKPTEYLPHILNSNKQEIEDIFDSELIQRNKIDGIVRMMYYQSEEFKELDKRLNEIYNSNNFKIKRDREIKKIYKQEQDIRKSLEEQVNNMTEKERELLSEKLKKDFLKLMVSK